MKLYIDSKQFIILLTPFILLFFLYFFKEDILSDIDHTFIKNEKYSNFHLNEKVANRYLLLDKELIKYNQLSKNDLDETYILKRVLIPVSKNRDKKAISNKNILNLEFVLISRDKKIACINGKLLRVGEKIGENIIIDIKRYGVKIKNKKGVKWIKLLK